MTLTIEIPDETAERARAIAEDHDRGLVVTEVRPRLPVRRHEGHAKIVEVRAVWSDHENVRRRDH